MAIHALSDHFSHFFTKLNPSASFEKTAASEHRNITRLIESVDGPAATLAPRCFLQGSYRQDTAIYAINDVDIVALCELWYPSSGSGSGWTRDRIFRTIATAIAADDRYAAAMHFGPTSTVIHIDLGIKVEVLPVVYRAGNSDPRAEPFLLYRPERRRWEDGFAREHRRLLTLANGVLSGSNFKPMIKVLKHLRSHWRVEAVSFHIECLLYTIDSGLYRGGPADFIANVLGAIASTPADMWYSQGLSTPCGERDIFTNAEWSSDRWSAFHRAVSQWHRHAVLAQGASTRMDAIDAWRGLLGETYFPATVAR